LIRHTRIKNNEKNNIESAAKMNLKIIRVPIRYREDIYGTANIIRLKHGRLLLRKFFFALTRIKFICV